MRCLVIDPNLAQRHRFGKLAFTLPCGVLTEDRDFPMQGTALQRFLAVICMEKRTFVFFQVFSLKLGCWPCGDGLTCRHSVRGCEWPLPHGAAAALYFTGSAQPGTDCWRRRSCSTGPAWSLGPLPQGAAASMGRGRCSLQGLSGQHI